MEEAKEALKKLMRIALKVVKKILLSILMAALPIIILLAGALYILTVDDGTYNEDDWGSTPYAAGEYINGVSIDARGGQLNAGISAQGLWERVAESGGRLSEYLDTPQELARLMKAEIVTKYPDIRPNPDEEIDWESISENTDLFQGIIKFKRADSNQNVSTMIYKDPETFYNWIELYTQNGDESYKNEILTHFTLRPNNNASNTTNNSNTESNYTTSDIVVDCSTDIVEAANEVLSPGAGLCQAWVRQVYNQAGLGNVYYASAYEAFQNTCVSTSRDNIPIGAAVYGTGSGNQYGHVGIYIGNEQVMDNVGEIKTSSLDEWIGWQERNPTVIAGVQSGWLGWGWQAGSPTIVSGSGNAGTNNTSQSTTSSSSSSYVAVVATWEQVDTTITTDDPNVQTSIPSQYTMTTTAINYQEMVKPYIMPFDLLWALLVVGEDKNFVFEIADLAYRSDIQITIYDNLTVTTQVDEWHYTKRTEAIVDATITAICNEKTATGTVDNDIHDNPPHEETNYTTTKTVVTQTNTLSYNLTRADVWFFDYKNDYQYVSPTESVSSDTVTQKNQEYPSSPDSTGNSYSCEHIDNKKAEVQARVIEMAEQDNEDSDEGISADSVTINENISVRYYSKYIDIYDNITNTIRTQSYVRGVPSKEYKVDPNSQVPNFVTIFNKTEYRMNRSNINSANQWLFEILETNDSTANMVDLIKFLLSQATGRDYGVTRNDVDVDVLNPSELITVGEGDYVVDIEKSPSNLVITDLNKLKLAFSGYSGNSKLMGNAQTFLDLQQQYKVNAIFAAAVSISETGAGRAGHAVDGKNNWFNIECRCGNSAHGRFETYANGSTESIESFFRLIKQNYFSTVPNAQNTVATIGTDPNHSIEVDGWEHSYCEDADLPGAWTENTTTYMTQMFNAVGISI